MKEKIKKIPILGNLLIKYYSVFLRLKNRKLLKRNAGLKNSIAGKRCFIVATGPSIKNQNLKQLAGETAITVSNFFVHPDFQIIKPFCHLFVPSHPPVTEEQYAEWFKESEKIFPAGQKILISISDKHLAEKSGAFKNQDAYYYEPGSVPLAPDGKIDFTKDIPLFQTSVHIAIYLALYGGAKEIILLGCDHDWILHLNETRHFYDEKESALARDGYDEWKGKDLEYEFQSYVNLWKIYKKIRAFAEANGVKITNAAPGSLLDVFPKKKLDNIISSR